jgi:hypothetical protein
MMILGKKALQQWGNMKRWKMCIDHSAIVHDIKVNLLSNENKGGSQLPFVLSTILK